MAGAHFAQGLFFWLCLTNMTQYEKEKSLLFD